MTNKLEVEPYISNSSYFFEQKNSRCYIVNEKKHCELILDGVFADLWYIILKTQNYNEVKEYAKSRNIADNLDEFIEELKFTGIIKNEYDIHDIKEKKVYIPSELDDNIYKKEHSEKFEWFYKHHLINFFTFELSYKCNLNCKHCYNDKDMMEKSIDFETAKSIIDDAIKIGAKIFSFTNGECTIHPDLLKILKYLREKRKSFQLITNGQKLSEDKDFFEEIVRLYPNLIRISLYSMDTKIHDNITGVKGSQEKTIDAIKKLLSRNVPVCINYFQLSLNKDCINDVRKFSEEVGAVFSPGAHFIYNKKNNNIDTAVTDEQIYSSYIDKNSSLYCLLEQKNHCFTDKEAPLCGAVINLAVNPFLDVVPCAALRYKLGNLKEKTLENIFNNEYKKFVEIFKTKNLKDCINCEFFEHCFYLPCMGMYENGFLKKSDICCKFTKIRMEVLKEQGKLLNCQK